MELPDFMSYSGKFSSKGFVEKISRIAKRAGSKLVYSALLLYYTLQSKSVSVKDKAFIVGALGYLISPLDAIPDAIPIVGLGDDLAVLLFVTKKMWGQISEEAKNKAQAKLSTWFDDDEMKEIEEIFPQEELEARKAKAEEAKAEEAKAEEAKAEAPEEHSADLEANISEQ